MIIKNSFFFIFNIFKLIINAILNKLHQINFTLGCENDTFVCENEFLALFLEPVQRIIEDFND